MSGSQYKVHIFLLFIVKNNVYDNDSNTMVLHFLESIIFSRD